MKEQYNKLFEDVHLSEAAKEKIMEQEEEQSFTGSKRSKGRTGIKAAVLVGIMFLGSTGIYAATQLQKSSEKQPDRTWQVETDKELTDIADITLATSKPEQKKDENLYDVKLSYIPDGYKQDKKDTFFYRKGKKDENGFFSVILYHMNADYKTIQAKKGLEEFQTKDGQGYIADKGHRYVARFMYNDSSYMLCIDGSNMPKKEVRKIAENASLYQVAKKKDIQASYIEWTDECQKEMDAYIKRVKKLEKDIQKRVQKEEQEKK